MKPFLFAILSLFVGLSVSSEVFADVEVGSCSCTCSGPNIDGPIDIEFDLFDHQASCHSVLTGPDGSCSQPGTTVNCTYTPYVDGGKRKLIGFEAFQEILSFE